VIRRALLVGALSAGAALGAAAPPLPLASEAWIPAAPPGARMHAGYLLVRNPAPVAQRLVAVGSDAHARVELHETVVRDGAMTMEQRRSLALPARGELRFAPGGLHLMLLEPTRELAPGARVVLRLRFADGRTLSVTAEVRDARTTAPHHHGS